MTFDIFQVDWITVDIIIIVLLILLLIGVKVLKEVYRWRFFFSNPSTIRRVDNLLNINNQFSSLSIKKCTLTKSSVYQQEDLTKPTIIIIRRNRKQMLLKALTEAFCTLGYNVINVRLKMVIKNDTELLTSDINKELQQTFSAILMFYNQETHSVSKNYNVIDLSKEIMTSNLLLKDYHCSNIILINPCLKSCNLEVFLTLLNDSNKYSKIVLIFSEKLILFFKNKNVKKEMLSKETFTNSNLTVIQKAKSTFKYYETILLGVIIRYIEK